MHSASAGVIATSFFTERDSFAMSPI
jgi:hypothetical protein